MRKDKLMALLCELALLKVNRTSATIFRFTPLFQEIRAEMDFLEFITWELKEKTNYMNSFHNIWKEFKDTSYEVRNIGGDMKFQIGNGSGVHRDLIVEVWVTNYGYDIYFQQETQYGKRYERYLCPNQLRKYLREVLC